MTRIAKWLTGLADKEYLPPASEFRQVHCRVYLEVASLDEFENNLLDRNFTYLEVHPVMDVKDEIHRFSASHRATGFRMETLPLGVVEQPLVGATRNAQ